jgi:hypothetical protein
MATYLTPADVAVSDNRQDHLDRDSAEPGTDYKTAYGTDLRAPFDGVVIGVDHDNGGAEGRRITFLLDNGEVIDWIHLSQILVSVGFRFRRGQRGLALSGASGFGRDWYYAPHVHVTRRTRRGLSYRQTVDFEDLTRDPTPAANTAQTPPIAQLLGSDHEMIWIARVRAAYYLIVPQGSAKPRAVQLGGVGYNPTEPYAKIPQINFEDDWSIDKLRQAVEGM